MDFPTYTVQDLADFTQRPVEEFIVNYSNTSITQASLLLRLATCLKEPPTDLVNLELWQNAVLDMAFKLYLSARHAESKYSPFSSETIGSYSYTIAMSKIQNGEQTGVLWFDIAVSQLGVCDFMGGTGTPSSGGTEVFEYDGTFVQGDLPGNRRILSPNDIGKYPNFPLDGR